MQDEYLTLTAAAAELRVPPSLLSSLRYRRLIPDGVVKREGNHTYIQRSFLLELRQIIAARSRRMPQVC